MVALGFLSLMFKMRKVRPLTAVAFWPLRIISLVSSAERMLKSRDWSLSSPDLDLMGMEKP